MAFNFNDYTTDRQYDLLKRVVEAVQKDPALTGGADCAFQDEDGKVNLVGIRGLKDGVPCESKNHVYDDTLFVVFKEGEQKKVEAFSYSTEYGNEGTAVIALGQHKYRLHYHKEDLTAHLNLSTAASWASDHKYRALEPNPEVRVLRDTNRSQEQDTGEEYEMNASINIHYGGENSPGAWSEGCQVVKGWANFKRLIKLVETDHSISGSINNELADKPATDGTRTLIYTLVTGAYLEKVASESSLFFPMDLGKGAAASEESIAHYFEVTEKASPGGFYPVGANSVWHGGVHVRAPGGTNVLASLDGRIVAARLAEEDKAIGQYGSRNFILLEHRRGELVFFSLYMHLSPEKLAAEESFLKQLPWIGKQRVRFRFTQKRNYRSEPKTGDNVLGTFEVDDVAEWVEDAEKVPWKKVKKVDADDNASGPEVYVSYAEAAMEMTTDTLPDTAVIDRLKGGGVVKLDVPVRGGDLLWRSGEYGSPEYRTGLLHWEIFSEENVFPPPQPPGGDGAAAPAAPAGGAASTRTILVNGVEGPKQAYPNEEAAYRVSKFNVTDPTPSEKLKVSWVVKQEETELARFEQHGAELKYKIPIEQAGKTIQVMPFINNPSDKVRVVTTVAARERVQWKTIEDADGNFNMDSAALMKLFEDSQGFWGTDDVLTGDELKSFYASDKAVELRRYACKFTSEWGIKDLDKAISDMRGRWVTYGLKDRLQPYLWWDEAKGAGVTLPASPNVWHYNPVFFVETLWAHGSGAFRAEIGGEPVFFVKRGGSEVQVARPADTTGTEKVFVRESAGDEWEMGKRFFYQTTNSAGLTRRGSPMLYELLIDPAATEGVPTSMTDFDKRVWGALSKAEGGLDAINSYDDAFLSFGPFQQTVGTVTNKGELQGALKYVKDKNGAVYDRYFGKHKLDVADVAPESGVDKGHFVLDGDKLNNAAKKEVMRDFIWAYRALKAMGNVDFRMLFLEHGFKRLENLRDWKATTTVNGTSVEVRVGDVYQTDLAQALLLDVHINRPAYVHATTANTPSNNKWVNDVRDKLVEKSITNPSELTQDDEYALIKKFIERRNASGMTDKYKRAADILACVKKDALESFVEKLGYASVQVFCTALSLDHAIVNSSSSNRFLSGVRE